MLGANQWMLESEDWVMRGEDWVLEEGDECKCGENRLMDL